MNTGKTLSDEDIEAIALRVVQVIGMRLRSGEIPPPPPLPTPPSPPAPPKQPPPKLSYTLKELAKELGVSRASIYRLTARGLLTPLPYLRVKIYSREEVERFLRGAGGKGFRF